MSLLADIASYSRHVHSLHERFAFVTASTLCVIPMGATLARVEGRLECAGGLAIEVWELVDSPNIACAPTATKSIVGRRR